MKRLFTILLLVALALTACASPNPPIDGTTEATEVPTDAETTTPNDTGTTDSDVTTDPSGTDDPPALSEIDPVTGEAVVDLGGYVYRASCYDNNASGAVFFVDDFLVADATKDAFSYAVYDRNKTIENTYNCRIRQEYSYSSSQYGALTYAYLNDQPYELAIVGRHDAVLCSQVGLLHDLYTLDAIHLDHDAYDQNSIRELGYGGKLYYLSGDMNTSSIGYSAVTIFNADMFAQYDFVTACGNEAYDNLYEMVAEGKWTISAMLEMAEVVNLDADQSGGPLKIPTLASEGVDGGDIAGYMVYSATPMFYWYGCGARISSTADESEYPTLTFGTEENGKETFDFLFGMLNNRTEGNEWINSIYGTARILAFKDNRLMFTDCVLRDVTSRLTLYAAEDVSYGILPTPKYSEEQDRYYDVVFWAYVPAWLWSVPVACQDAGKASFMFHLMAQYSGADDGIMNAYIESALYPSIDLPTAGAYDAMRTVHDSLTYDIALVYDWGGFIYYLINGLSTAEKNLYDEIVTEENLAAAVADMNKTLEYFKNPTEPNPDVALAPPDWWKG